MQPIETAFTRGSYRFQQVERHGNFAIYQQQHSDNPKVIRFEVIRIRVQPAGVAPSGSLVPEREAYAGSSSWGRDGFTCYTLAEAEGLMQRLLPTATEHEDEKNYDECQDHVPS